MTRVGQSVIHTFVSQKGCFMPSINPAEAHLVSRWVLHHSAFLPQLEARLKDLCPEHHVTPNFQLLSLILQYYQEIRTPDPPYMDLYEGFSAFGASQEMDEVAQFFVRHYKFQNLIRADAAGEHTPYLRSLLNQDKNCIRRLEESERADNLMFGFTYMNDVLLTLREEKSGASELFINAAKRWIAWFWHTVDAREEYVVVCDAARKVKALRPAFVHMFPTHDPEEWLDILYEELMTKVEEFCPN